MYAHLFFGAVWYELSRLQQPGETLSQFGHALNGVAAISDFGVITTTLLLDVYSTYE